MRLRGLRAGLLPALLAGVAAPAGAATADDIRRSLALRDSWQYLTREVAWPAAWTPDGTRFAYRKTVAGGFAFEAADARTLAKAPAFDQVRLAAGLAAALGRPVEPLRLPFAEFAYGPGARSITFTLDEAAWSCDLATYRCAAERDRSRPRAFGVVRDLSVPADDHPRRSPDGRWEAWVEQGQLVVRARGSARVVPLSHDGSPRHFYDPETLR